VGTHESIVQDPIDRRILGVLAIDGRISWLELGRRVSLSASAAAERVRRLEQRGIITGYAAVVDPVALGRTLDAVIGIRAVSGFDRRALEAWLCDRASVVEVTHLTGPHDYLVRVRCTDAAELDDLLMTMKSDAGVADTETRVVLRSLPVRPAIA
jgi:Lrp/AsnC family transcriptional regulator, leucine-responsive regulatory protein